jgi:MFS transporter, SP family, sugar:H+ symporter
MIIVGRCFSGLSIGTLSLVVPMYIAETSPAKIRGSLTTIYQLMITFGIFIANIVNTIINATVNKADNAIWRIALSIQVIPASKLKLPPNHCSACKLNFLMKFFWL